VAVKDDVAGDMAVKDDVADYVAESAAVAGDTGVVSRDNVSGDVSMTCLVTQILNADVAGLIILCGELLFPSSLPSVICCHC
jgi:hypothetical protein